jgi:hypothetical protein
VPVPDVRDSRTHPASTDAFHVHSGVVVIVNELEPAPAPTFLDGGAIEYVHTGAGAASCVTRCVWPLPNEKVAVRELCPVLGSTVYVSCVVPEPFVGFRDAHVESDVAVHRQSFRLVVTVNVSEPPLAPMFRVAGAIE